MTPNMFLHLLSLQAFEYVIAYDKNEKQLGSGKSFAKVQDQILFHMILDYASHFERKGFINILKELLDAYNWTKRYVQQDHDPIVKVKQIMITGILKKFSLGTYDPAMCGLASHFDMQLREHLEILSTFSIDAIRIAASREAKDYTCSIQKMLKSLGVVSLAYATLVFDITLFQKSQENWCYCLNCGFQQTLEEQLGVQYDTLSIIFERSKHHLVHAGIPFNDIVTGKIDKDDVFDWFKTKSGSQFRFFILYPQIDMYRALMMNYETQKEDTPDNQARKKSRLIWIQICFSVLNRNGLMGDGIIIQYQDILLYEIFDYAKQSDHLFIDWHRKAIAMEKFGVDVDTDLSNTLDAYKRNTYIASFHVFQ